MQKNTNDIILFFIIVTLLVFALMSFIIIMLYLYRKKQISFLQNLEKIKLDHEKNLMATQLEIQESTFQHISREIHDNINLSLTLAKLQLNTLNWSDRKLAEERVAKSVELLGQAINDLSDISKSLNADIILHHGLIKAIEDEVLRIEQAGLFSIDSQLTGEPIYMEAQRELIAFRIVQEAFNNILKHAEATHTELSLHYDSRRLYIAISDDGNGFDTHCARDRLQAGLKNMDTRIKMLRGTMTISSLPGFGTTLSFTIPFD